MSRPTRDLSSTFGSAAAALRPARRRRRPAPATEGTLPDTSEVTAVNILIPLGKDAFTWQSTERTAAGSELPDLPPLKVTRVKADK